jgi:hypothetical protein
VLSQRHPRFLTLYQKNDEIFSILLLLLENHHLRHYGNSKFPTNRTQFPDASFAENFYGLKRVRIRAVPGKLTPNEEPISRKSRYASLLLLVILFFDPIDIRLSFHTSKTN